jgi:hypothetical protein
MESERVLWNRTPDSPRGNQMARVRVNVLCLIGIAIAFVSTMAAWSIYSGIPFNVNVQASPDVLVPQLFILGTLISLLTPLGGIIQFVSAIETILFWMSSDHSQYQYLTIMPYIAVFASIVVLLSIRSPRWIQLDRGEIPGRGISTRLMRSLLTFWVEPNRLEGNQENTVKEI